MSGSLRHFVLWTVRGLSVDAVSPLILQRIQAEIPGAVSSYYNVPGILDHPMDCPWTHPWTIHRNIHKHTVTVTVTIINKKI